MKKAILAVVLGVYACSAAAFLNGNTLLEKLRVPVGRVDRSIALGYVMGVADQFDYSRQYQGATRGFCFAIPEDVTSGQVADIVQQWLEKNPQHRHYGAAGLVSVALEAAFPCKK